FSLLSKVLFLLLILGSLNADKNTAFQRFLFVKKQGAVGDYALEIGCVFGHGVLPLVAELRDWRDTFGDVVLFNTVIAQFPFQRINSDSHWAGRLTPQHRVFQAQITNENTPY